MEVHQQPLRQCRGHFVLHNCLILGEIKYKGVQRIYCDPFPKKLYYGSNRMDLVFVRPPGVEYRGFVLTPDSVWYYRVLLLFSTKVLTDTGSKKLDCALVSTLKTYEKSDKGDYCDFCNY